MGRSLGGLLVERRLGAVVVGLGIALLLGERRVGKGRVYIRGESSAVLANNAGGLLLLGLSLGVKRRSLVGLVYIRRADGRLLLLLRWCLARSTCSSTCTTTATTTRAGRKRDIDVFGG